jgi:hypothetical protein
MRLRAAAFSIVFFTSTALLPVLAETGIGVLDVWLKAREAADAPNDQKITLYRKSKALVVGIDAYDGRGWPQLSNGVVGLLAKCQVHPRKMVVIRGRLTKMYYNEAFDTERGL